MAGRFAIVTCMCVSVCGSAVAQEMPTPRPPAEMEQLKPFVGAWKCESTPAGRSTFTMKMDLDGFWLVGSFQEEKTKDKPDAIRAAEMWGYDPATKLFAARFLATSHVVGTGQSRGWDGDAFVWTTEAKVGDKTFQERTIFIRDKTGKTMTVKGESLNGASWTPTFTSTCKK